jgi:predicted Ser/Thr protein kinase
MSQITLRRYDDHHKTITMNKKIFIIPFLTFFPLYHCFLSNLIHIVASFTVYPSLEIQRFIQNVEKKKPSKLITRRKGVISVMSIALACIFCNPNNVCLAEEASSITSGIHNNNHNHQHQDLLSWNLPNGQVQLSNPFIAFSQRSLLNPTLLGSGGGGAVFSMQQQSSISEHKEEQKVAVKISWVASAESVKKECKILNLLEDKKVRNVERCLGLETYPFDNNRVMIALQPVVNDSTSSIIDLDKAKQVACVESIMKTLVDMLSSNVVVTDVQFLINRNTGDVSSKVKCFLFLVETYIEYF